MKKLPSVAIAALDATAMAAPMAALKIRLFIETPDVLMLWMTAARRPTTSFLHLMGTGSCCPPAVDGAL
jgi:hypothetical protein